MTAGEAGTRDAVVASPEESLVAAARRMREYHVGALIVIDEFAGRSFPVGILTDRDIVIGAVAEGAARVERATVRDVMTNQVLWAHHEDPLEDVLARMTALGVRRVPLVDDDGCVVGVLAFDDVIGQVSEELADLARLVAHARGRERMVVD